MKFEDDLLERLDRLWYAEDEKRGETDGKRTVKGGQTA